MSILHSTRSTLVIIAFIILHLGGGIADKANASPDLEPWLYPKEDIGSQEFLQILISGDHKLHRKALQKLLMFTKDSSKYLFAEKLDKLIDPLIMLLKDEKCNNKDLAAQVLGGIIDEERMPMLVDYIFSGIPKEPASDIYLDDSYYQISSMDHRAIPYIEKRSESGNVNERRAAVKGIPEMRDPRDDHMLKAMRDPDATTRELAVRNLYVSLVPGYEIRDSVVTMLYDDSEDMQYYTMILLPRMYIIDQDTIDEICKLLVEICKDPSKSMRNRSTAVDIIVRLKDEKSIDVLIESLNSDDAELRGIVLENMVYTNSHKAIEAVFSYYEKANCAEIEHILLLATTVRSRQAADIAEDIYRKGDL